MQISDAFKATFGETEIAAADTNSRVRPVYEWQCGGNWSGGLGFIRIGLWGRASRQLLLVRRRRGLVRGELVRRLQ